MMCFRSESRLLSAIKPGAVKKINRLPTPIAGLVGGLKAEFAPKYNNRRPRKKQFSHDECFVRVTGQPDGVPERLRGVGSEGVSAV